MNMNMQLSVNLDDEVRAIAARSEIYKILSGIFVYPDDDQIEQFVLCDAADALRDAAKFLPYKVDAFDSVGTAPRNECTNLRASFTRLFDNCGGRPALSMHEKDYSSVDTKNIWEELIRFYEYFGLAYELGKNKEWPDWIGMEFEFLHYLTFLEAGVGKERSAAFVSAETDFLERHLGLWIPQFSTKLSSLGADTPYGGYADVMTQFIVSDLKFNQERRTRQQPEKSRH